MTLLELQDLVFPKYQEYTERYGVCPNNLIVSEKLAWQLYQVHGLFNTQQEQYNPHFAGMKIRVDYRLTGNEFKLGVLV